MLPADLLLADTQARMAALDVDRCFIVQAPGRLRQDRTADAAFPRAAGRGRAARGAARDHLHAQGGGRDAQARPRVAAPLRDPASELRAETRALAPRVLAAMRARTGACCANPSRLRMLTIDALNQSLSRRLPVLSGLGAGLGIDEDGARAVRAGRRASARAPAVGRPAHRRGCRHPARAPRQQRRQARRADRGHARAARSMAARAAGRRRRLRPGRRGPRSSKRLERSWCGAIWRPWRRRSRRCCSTEICGHARGAAQVLREDGKDSPILACGPGVPGARRRRPAALAGARGVPADRQGWAAQELHRQRRRAAADRKRPELAALKAQIQAVNRPVRAARGLCEPLDATRELPPGEYQDAEWTVLKSLLLVLRLAAAELKTVFADRKAADYPEFAAAARQALGTADEPTDTALVLDARLRHVLVDEFQDTSKPVPAAPRLTAGWARGDGRTLFAGRRSDAVDLPLPQSRGRPVPRRARPRARRGANSSRWRCASISARPSRSSSG